MDILGLHLISCPVPPVPLPNTMERSCLTLWTNSAVGGRSVRRDVVIQPEHVLRVVRGASVFNEAGELVRPTSGDRLGSEIVPAGLRSEEVDVFASGGKQLKRSVKGSRPGLAPLSLEGLKLVAPATGA